MTSTVVLTSTPVQVANGSKEVFLTVNKGRGLKYATGATIPDKSSYHELTSYSMNIGSGFSIWVWNDSSVPVVISYSESV